MPREHARVSARLWTGDTSLKLRQENPHVRNVQVWLLTNDTAIAEPYGLYLLQIDVAIVQIGSGITEAIFDASIARLETLGFLRWDARSRFVWVVNMTAQQLLENRHPLKLGDWRIVAARRWYASCRDNPFLGGFFDLYADYLHLVDRRQGIREGASEAPINTSTSDLVFDLVPEEGGVGGETRKRVGSADPEIRRQTFETWWKLYPVKVGKGAAWEEFEREKPPFEELLLTTRAYIDSEEWQPKNDGRRAIPHPRTFLHQRRWEDTPTPYVKLLPTKELEEIDHAWRRARGPGQGLPRTCPHEPSCSTRQVCWSRIVNEEREADR